MTETKTTPMHKLACALVALVMAIGICVPTAAFAANGNSGSITISGQPNETYTIYQVFDLTYADDESSYSYKVVDGWTSFISGYTYTNGSGDEVNLFKLDDNGYLDPSSPVFNEEEGSAVMVAFAKAALAYAEGNTSITGTSTTADENGKVSFTDLPLGWYLVDTSLGSLCMLTSTDPDATVKEKNGVPTLDKSADHVTDDNGEMIEYTIDITDITGALNLKLHDYMDSDLKLQEDGDYFKVTVTLYPSAEDEEQGINGKTLVYGEDYTVTLTGEGKCTQSSETNCTFEVDFTGYDFSNCTEDYVLHVVYDCDVNTEGEGYDGDEVDLQNLAHLTYGTATHSPDVEWDVYLFGFEIHKYTEDESTYLAGAKFEINDEDGCTAYFLYEENQGIYLFEGWLEDGETVPEGYTTTLTSTDLANIKIEGLSEGVYTVTETAAPDGYNKLTGSLTVTITYTGTEENPGTFTVTYDGKTLDDYTLYVENNTGQELPGTGGMGTTIFYIIGGILVVGAVVLLITRRRMNNRA